MRSEEVLSGGIKEIGFDLADFPTTFLMTLILTAALLSIKGWTPRAQH
jgi:hypothetical protein